MFAIMITAGLIGRTYDSASALSLAAVITLAGQPANLTYSGFLLSYVAVIGAAVVWPVCRGMLGGTERFWKSVKKTIMVCTVITLTTLPLTELFFYEIPVFSVLPNLVMLPTMVWVMGSGILGSCVGLVSAEIGKLCLLPASGLLWLYEQVTQWVQKLPGAVWICGRPMWVQAALYYGLLSALLFGAAWARKEKNQEKKAALFLRSGKGKAASAGIVLAAVLGLTVRVNPPLSVTVLDVGQGDAIVVRRGGQAWMIDAGSTDEKNVGTYRVLPYLKSQGIGTLDGIFVTHSDEDHVNGVREVLELSQKRMTSLRVRRLFLPAWMKGGACAKELETLARGCGTTVQYIKAGDTVSGGGLRMEILHPDSGDYQNEPNAGSVVISLSYGTFDALLTGDLEAEGEKKVTDLLERRGETYEYLKVAHHGSRNSTFEAFLETAAPKAGVISCSESGRYGHPHQELLERLGTAGTDIYTTPDNGAVSCVTDGRSWRISGYTGTERYKFFK